MALHNIELAGAVVQHVQHCLYTTCGSMWNRLLGPNLILLFAEQGFVGVDELQIGGGGDVDVAPLFGQEGLAEGLHALMEQHTQLWHHRTHLRHRCHVLVSDVTLVHFMTPLTQTHCTQDCTISPKDSHHSDAQR